MSLRFDRMRGLVCALSATIALSACSAVGGGARADADTGPEADARPRAGAEASVAAAPAIPDRIPLLTHFPTQRLVAVAGMTETRDESTAGAVTSLPPGWEPYTIHPTKARTRYRLESLPEGMRLRAEADASASGLMAKVSIEPSKTPILTWRWKIDALVEGADISDRYAEDSPVRIMLAFDGDKGALPMRDQLFFEQVKFFTGREMPYATLMYVWENRKPVETVVHNPHTGRVRKIVVASGEIGVREWLVFKRDIVADYKRAYGTDPGRLVGVGLMTDTDNTKTRVIAWYGDITLER